MKSALFVQANVTKLTKGALFVWKFPRFFKKIGQRHAISVWYDGKISSHPHPVSNISGKSFLSALFNITKCPWKPVPPSPNLLTLPTPLFK
jgi:hypothetical protein